MSQPFLYDKNAANILKALLEGAKRYVNLSDACHNEHTRTDKIRILENLKLIRTKIRKVGKRNSIFYELTEKGREMIELIEKIESILCIK